ncbi:FBD domain [Arabidopsis suecica]|uniref:FBD domain n=1 Tax=Arabidopsis suecica TaxID=45249 RepID=A0A8T1XSN9_ARASU|nr:FBD domain [Arabidopsis suecica]
MFALDELWILDSIDSSLILNFTFAPRLDYWESYHKEEIKNNSYLLKFLNEVKIFGYKGYWHELDVVEFFVKNAPSHVKLELAIPKKAKTKAHASLSSCCSQACQTIF